jgi:hypothetical protein
MTCPYAKRLLSRGRTRCHRRSLANSTKLVCFSAGPLLGCLKERLPDAAASGLGGDTQIPECRSIRCITVVTEQLVRRSECRGADQLPVSEGGEYTPAADVEASRPRRWLVAGNVVVVLDESVFQPALSQGEPTRLFGHIQHGGRRESNGHRGVSRQNGGRFLVDLNDETAVAASAVRYRHSSFFRLNA